MRPSPHLLVCPPLPLCCHLPLFLPFLPPVRTCLCPCRCHCLEYQWHLVYQKALSRPLRQAQHCSSVNSPSLPCSLAQLFCPMLSDSAMQILLHKPDTCTVALCYPSHARIWALPRQEPHLIHCFVWVRAQCLAPGRVSVNTE